MCDLHPKYLPINKWNRGFAHVTVNDDNTFTVNNKKIIDKEVR